MFRRGPCAVARESRGTRLQLVPTNRHGRDHYRRSACPEIRSDSTIRQADLGLRKTIAADHRSTPYGQTPAQPHVERNSAPRATQLARTGNKNPTVAVKAACVGFEKFAALAGFLPTCEA